MNLDERIAKLSFDEIYDILYEGLKVDWGVPMEVVRKRVEDIHGDSLEESKKAIDELWEEHFGHLPVVED